MADVKISALPSAATVAGTDTVPLVQGGVTKRATVAVFVAGTVPTGTGLRKVVGGVEAAAAATLVDADVSASAAIAVTKVAAGAANTVLCGGASNAFRTLVDADVNAAAALAVTKIAAGAANTVLCGGASNSFRTIVNADINASAAIDGAKIVAATTGVPGTMSAADKTKLDGIQVQGASSAIAALAIDWSLAGVFTKTIASNSTFTFSNATSGRVIIVRVTAGAGNTVTWPTVKWAGGVAPTQTSSGTDVYTFVHDGTNIYGSVVQAMA